MAFNTELPSYMFAADVHNVANGAPSVVDYEAESSTLDTLTKGTLSVIARGVTSAFNTVPAATNWLGITDIPEWQTEDLLRSFDDDLAAYYQANSQTVDVIGDIAASFVPGMAAVKGLNYAQKSLAGLSRGSAGRNILQSIGALPDKADELVKVAAQRMQTTGQTFNMLDSNVIKAFGTKYAQNALEFAVFETAAATTMGEFSPLFSEHTYKDVLYNAALGGGIIGGGILGTVSAVQTYGVVKRVRNEVDKALHPFRRITESPEGVDDWVQILHYKNQLDTPLNPAAGSVEAKVYEKTRRELDLSMQELFTKVAGGDAEIGAVLHSSIKGMNQDQAWAALQQLKSVSRSTATDTIGNKLAAARAANTILKDPEYLATLTPKEVASLSEKAAYLKKGAEKFLHLEGDDLMKVTHTAPVAPKLADYFTGSELKSELSKRVAKQPAMGNDFNPTQHNYLDVEARYHAAFGKTYSEGVLIHGNDLPHLEAAYSSGVKTVTVDGVLYDQQQLLHHIKVKKEDFAAKMLMEAEIDPLANTDRIARALNLKRAMIEGGGKNVLDDSSYFLNKSAQDFARPSAVRLGYDSGGASAGVSGDVLSGMVRLREAQIMQHKVNQAAVSHALSPEELAQLPVITDRHILASTSGGAGAGLATFASGEYGTLASVVEFVGKTVNRLKTQGQKYINESLQPRMISVLQNSTAGAEIAALRQAVIATGEHYIWNAADGVAVLKSVAAWEKKVAAGASNLAKPEIPPGVAEKISVNTEEARRFLDEWVRLGDEQLSKIDKMKHAVGQTGPSHGGVLYFPQPNPKQFPFFAFVVPKSIHPGAEEKVQMIWAATAQDLAALEAKVPEGYRTLTKADTERYYKAMDQYQYDLGMNSFEIKTDLRRSGVAAPFFPKTDPQQLLQEMLEWRHKQSDKIVRDAVSLNYSVPFSELKRLDTEYRNLITSTKGKVPVDSPYESYVKTALDIPRTNHALWSEFNNLAENTFSLMVNKVKDATAKLRGDDAIAETNRIFDQAGVRGIKDAATELLANHPAGGKELSRFVLAMNGALSTLMLRTDPMNALNNGIGHLVMTGDETAYLIKLVKGLGKNAEDELLKQAYVGVPGSSKQILSPTKLVSDAYGDWVALLSKDPEAMKWHDLYDKNGWMPSMMDQMRSVVDGATLTKLETASQLRGKTESIWENTTQLLEKTTGNKGVEEMNRFTAARIAHRLTDIAVKNGGMTAQEQLTYINTFVNRTQGNYLASQRPLLFQGPVGHAISLFQTYSFNMMQRIFRHVEQGDKKQTAILLGLQSSIYGLNGLPAFDFMNRHLVGMAAGNTSGMDAASFLRQGGDVGNWLLYGSLSNATGLGLYSRGDLNPRNATLVASSFGDIPFVSATRNVLGSFANVAGEVGAGASVPSSLLRGLEHAGISRPLAGLAASMQGLTNEEELGYSTSGKNQLMTTWDMWSMQSVTRIAGARPLDEAVARDAYHRVQVYDAHRSAEINEVGSAIRDKVRAGNEVTQEEFHNFMSEYLHRGGKQKDFIQYWQQQVKTANKSQLESLVGNANHPYSRYMQTMMGGTE